MNAKGGQISGDRATRERRKEKARRGQEGEKMSPGVGESEKLKDC